MRFAIVETGFKPSLYNPTMICDLIGVSTGAVYQGSFITRQCGCLLTLHVYEGDTDIFNNGEEMEAEVLVLTDMVVLSDVGRAMIPQYIYRLMSTMRPGSRHSNKYRFVDYYINDITRYTFRLENDVTKEIEGHPVAGYIDLFTTSLLMTSKESKFFLSEAKSVGKYKLCTATFSHSTYLESLAAEMLYSRDVTQMDA